MTQRLRPVSVVWGTIVGMEEQESVDELHPGMGGRWLVTTQGSTHVWDLDALTYVRLPGPESLAGAFDCDGEAVGLTRVDRWPKVGATSLLWFDDPDRPMDIERWRQSSKIVSIVGMAASEDDSG